MITPLRMPSDARLAAPNSLIPPSPEGSKATTFIESVPMSIPITAFLLIDLIFFSLIFPFFPHLYCFYGHAREDVALRVKKDKEDFFHLYLKIFHLGSCLSKKKEH